MTKKEIVKAIEKEIEKLPDGGSFVFGYCVGDDLLRTAIGDIKDILLICEKIKIDTFNKQTRRKKEK